ncbi:MAG: hypothetical protein J0H14_02925 [Alphaproteobacteria bacterium]|nr:hypothetical protein [Alphaproteobacteria bacterium]
MSFTASSSPPTGLMARFAGLIGAIVWGLGDSLERQRRFGWGEAWLVPLADVLRGYLADTLARFTALHDRFLAGTLPAPRLATAGARTERPRLVHRPPAIPRGPVFIEYGMRPYDLALGRLLDDPEMREFLAAVPQAGRLLRPLWRRLTTEPLPEILRAPSRPPRPAKPAASGPPGLSRVTLSDGATSWDPIPCRPSLSPAPRGAPAGAVEPPPAARPAARDAPPPPEPERKQRDYLWIGRFLMR